MNIIWALQTVLVGLVALVLVAVSVCIAGILFAWAVPLPFAMTDPSFRGGLEGPHGEDGTSTPPMRRPEGRNEMEENK